MTQIFYVSFSHYLCVFLSLRRRKNCNRTYFNFIWARKHHQTNVWPSQHILRNVNVTFDDDIVIAQNRNFLIQDIRGVLRIYEDLHVDYGLWNFLAHFLWKTKRLRIHFGWLILNWSQILHKFEQEIKKLLLDPM